MPLRDGDGFAISGPEELRSLQRTFSILAGLAATWTAPAVERLGLKAVASAYDADLRVVVETDALDRHPRWHLTSSAGLASFASLGALALALRQASTEAPNGS